MMHKPGVPLDRIEGFPKEHALKLAMLSIDTAEEFLSVTNTPDKRKRIAVYLEIDGQELDRLIGVVERSLPESVAKNMKTPVDTGGKYGLGALGPETAQEDEQ